jgi:monovalent cation:H+ antiporter, CPA1 family
VEVHHEMTILMALLLVAAAVSIFVKLVRLPYAIALVIIGLLIGIFHLLPTIHVTPEVILLVFLPALLFEASWNLDLVLLRTYALPIGVLATVGVVITAGIIAGLSHWLVGVPIGVALIIGSVLSATDPVSVLAMFRKLGLDPRLNMILEGESLFNDGTAAVLFSLILAAVLSANVSSPLMFLVSFFTNVIGGVGIGVFIGLLGSKVTSFFDDHLLELMLTTLVAYGSFLIADSLHVSPVLSVISAGIVIGNYGSKTGMSERTREAVSDFWEYAAFLANSLVFLLIGLIINIDLLTRHAMEILAVIAGLLVSRAIVVYGLCPLLSTRQLPIALGWRHLLFWGALRGSLSMALALSISTKYQYREQIIVAVFGAVLFTLLVQGLTIEPLVRLGNKRS